MALSVQLTDSSVVVLLNCCHRSTLHSLYNCQIPHQGVGEVSSMESIALSQQFSSSQAFFTLGEVSIALLLLLLTALQLPSPTLCSVASRGGLSSIYSRLMDRH